ncbi:MAG: transposase [Armatimonadota bacterium]
MPRLPRMILIGVPYHVTQRGNHRQEVFLTDEDRRRYLIWLHEYAERYALDIWAYSLMSNHNHLVTVPRAEVALSRALQMTQARHTQRMNRLNGWEGHLWQGRFFASPLDPAYCWAAIRYVEQNPVRAGLVSVAADYPWSSAAAHCGLREDPLLKPITLDAYIPDWAAWLVREDPEESAHIRRQTLRDSPCGSESFLADLAARSGHPVLPTPRGRPRKK